MPLTNPESLSWVHGRHELKFGGGYQRLQVNALQGIATNGFYVFAGFPVVPDAFASFLFGQPVVFLQGLGDFERGIRGNAVNAYVQDTFKATSRLTLNLGLRYDLPFPYTEIKNRQTLWIPGRQSTVMSRRSAWLALSGRQGRARGIDPHFQEGLRAARGHRLGPDRKRQVAGHVRVRNFLRAVLHRAGWAAAVADQRSTVSADSRR